MKRYHRLKTIQPYFYDVAMGKKKFEIRSCLDRDFRVGDYLLLEEFDPIKGYSGNTFWVKIDYVLNADGHLGLKEGNVILSVSCVDRANDIRVKGLRKGKKNSLGYLFNFRNAYSLIEKEDNAQMVWVWWVEDELSKPERVNTKDIELVSIMHNPFVAEMFSETFVEVEKTKST